MKIPEKQKTEGSIMIMDEADTQTLSDKILSEWYNQHDMVFVEDVRSHVQKILERFQFELEWKYDNWVKFKEIIKSEMGRRLTE